MIGNGWKQFAKRLRTRKIYKNDENSKETPSVRQPRNEKPPNKQRQRLRNQSTPPKKKGYTRQQKRRRLRSKRKQQRPEKRSYTEYGRRHMRELTKKK